MKLKWFQANHSYFAEKFKKKTNSIKKLALWRMTLMFLLALTRKN
jgi:hypothetical protein